MSSIREESIQSVRTNMSSTTDQVPYTYLWGALYWISNTSCPPDPGHFACKLLHSHETCPWEGVFRVHHNEGLPFGDCYCVCCYMAMEYLFWPKGCLVMWLDHPLPFPLGVQQFAATFAWSTLAPGSIWTQDQRSCDTTTGGLEVSFGTWI